jgi:hypothetical protein
METAGVIRVVLLVDILAMALLALFYLRQRRMSIVAFCCWGMVAILLPVLGPFLVIVNRPGEWHPDPFPSTRLRQNIRQVFQDLVREYHYQRVRRTLRRTMKK